MQFVHKNFETRLTVNPIAYVYDSADAVSAVSPTVLIPISGIEDNAGAVTYYITLEVSETPLMQQQCIRHH